MNTTPSFVDNGILDAVLNPRFGAILNSFTFETSTSLSETLVTLDAYLAGDPLLSQYAPFAGTDGYDPAAAYGIGFLAMIAIEADGVTLNLGGYTLQQSEEHAFQQRFFGY